MSLILMKKTILGAYPGLNKDRIKRYNQRLKYAEEQFLGYHTHKHSIKAMFRNNPDYPAHQGICLCCHQLADNCICKVEVHKIDPFYANNPTPIYDKILNKISNNDLFIIKEELDL